MPSKLHTVVKLTFSADAGGHVPALAYFVALRFYSRGKGWPRRAFPFPRFHRLVSLKNTTPGGHGLTDAFSPLGLLVLGKISGTALGAPVHGSRQNPTYPTVSNRGRVPFHPHRASFLCPCSYAPLTYLPRNRPTPSLEISLVSHLRVNPKLLFPTVQKSTAVLGPGVQMPDAQKSTVVSTMSPRVLPSGRP